MEKSKQSLMPVAFGTRISLDDVPQDGEVGNAEYKRTLKQYHVALVKLQLRLAETARRSVVLVFEGPDAAGKGGAIKRLVEKLDPRVYRVYSTVKPTAEELARHYLWRFWTRLPKRGQIAVFDRSWYGRVLVERVEGFATKAEWKRAYQEIIDFEQLLAEDDAVILKFYVHISKAEQLHRFQKREADPLKRWKINDEDWRNRNKWDEHNEAAEEMFERTSTPEAPWHVVAGNDKWHARLEILRMVVTTLGEVKL
jgi:PPK2 family polyphosphate:nucleotide phosphotransferase